MFELKRLQQDSVPSALEKAERYRLLNEPGHAESICLDVLEVEPNHQRALVVLILARTDQFQRVGTDAPGGTQELIDRLQEPYDREYYSGVACERRGKALLHLGRAGAGPQIYDLLRRAMEHYEQAEQHRPPGNDDPVLRWNTCARMINRHDVIAPGVEDDFHPLLE